ncbi:MAG TPA: pseudouridine synthase, partial [Polyangiaceae bacterium]|nr:pseudouridine synthase [Polyangiaceae bacterium]
SPDDNGMAVDEAPQSDTLVFEGDTVELDGVVVEPGQRANHYIALNKPLGVTSTVADPDGFEDLSDCLRTMPLGVFPVGRLDRMTSGLLLFTTDGDLAHALLYPDHHVPKRYELVVATSLDADDPRLQALRRGVRIPGVAEAVRADEIVVLHRLTVTTTLAVRIHEGKHRQVRKMCHAVGLTLKALERVSIGNANLGDLSPGTHRPLLDAERASLWACAGGPTTVLERQLNALQRRARLTRSSGCPLLRLERWLEHQAT